LISNHNKTPAGLVHISYLQAFFIGYAKPFKPINANAQAGERNNAA
jgi:hypothetical protein